MDREQAKSDQRDNNGVFRYGAIIVIVLALLAITFNLMTHKHAAGPVQNAPTQSAPEIPQNTSPAK